MILSLHEDIRARVIDAAVRLFGLRADELPTVTVAYTPQRAMGDLAVPLAFELARRLRRPPKAIGQDMTAALGGIPGVARVDCAANGYLNFHLDRPRFLADRIADAIAPPLPAAPHEKVIVEHTAINPNKAAHIGHLRNAALGDTLVRALEFLGHRIETQNYIDDTGVQVADVVVGFRDLERRTLDEVRTLAARDRFDYLCWDLYARVTEWYGADPARQAVRASTLHEIEHGEGEAATMAAVIADRIVRCHLATMARLNVFYDLLTWEGDILRRQFWRTAFDALKAQGTVYFQDTGRLAGCWVMRIDADAELRPTGGADDGARATESGEDDADQAEKVIVRSNGTVTYVGKDMAYQFWKLGLLGLDFHYRPFGERGRSGPLWATASQPGEVDQAHPPFGRGQTIYNVIDVRQSYLQKLLKQALAAAGHIQEAERSVHFSYEMVALSHQTARQLGYAPDAQDSGRPFVEVSGRKGLGVKADDLIDALVAKAEQEVSKRNPDVPDAVRRRTAEMIAVAAVRYFMIRFSRGKVIAFDIDEALSFEGESGPYLQYAVVRANNIFQKLREREGFDDTALARTLEGAAPDELNGSMDEHGLWALVLEASRLDEIAAQAVRSLEFAVLAKWAFGLAQMFNGYYHKYPVLQEERADVKLWRTAGVAYFRAQLTKALGIMGIEVPPRM